MGSPELDYYVANKMETYLGFNYLYIWTKEILSRS